MKIIKISKYEVDQNKKWTEKDIEENLSFWNGSTFEREFPEIKNRKNEATKARERLPTGYYDGLVNQSQIDSTSQEMSARIKAMTEDYVVREYYLVVTRPAKSSYAIPFNEYKSSQIAIMIADRFKKEDRIANVYHVIEKYIAEENMIKHENIKIH
jgi:hypothetical protein